MLRNESQSLSDLSVKVREFLGSTNPAMKALRRDVLSHLEKLGNVYVIGGLVRDLAIYSFKERPISDVDFVVRCQHRRLKQIAERLGAAENRFGGFGLRTEAYRVDFWAFHNTWARKQGLVQMRDPSDLWKTTFFDWDAVVYGMTERKIWAIDKYLDRVRSGRVDINLEPNPSPLGTLVRALRRLMMWDARPSARLRHFVEERMQDFSWSEIVLAEANAFHVRYLDEFGTAIQYQEAVLRKATFQKLGSDVGRQQKIPEFADLPRQTRVSQLAPQLKLTVVPQRRKALKKAVQKSLFD